MVLHGHHPVLTVLCSRDVAAEALDELPSDPTDIEDAIHCGLVLGKPKQVLNESNKLDCWLSAHFADAMEMLDLIDRETLE